MDNFEHLILYHAEPAEAAEKSNLLIKKASDNSVISVWDKDLIEFNRGLPSKLISRLNSLIVI